MKASDKSLLISETEKESYWKNHTELLKSSGLSRVDYCRLNKVNYHQFGYWLGKQSHKNERLIAVTLSNTENTPTTATPSILCTLTLSNGRTLQIHDQHTLALILERI